MAQIGTNWRKSCAKLEKNRSQFWRKPRDNKDGIFLYFFNFQTANSSLENNTLATH